MKKIVTLLLVTYQVVVYGQMDSLKIQKPFGPDYSKTIYPKDDELTYDQYVGETIAGFSITEGWRQDSINGGFNKKIYDNPYVLSQGDYIGFDKNKSSEIFKFYRYKKGRKFSGQILDTLNLSYSNPRGGSIYYFIETGYEAKNLEVIFKANCMNGLIQGNGTLSDLNSKEILSRCNFKNGEIIGEVISTGIFSKFINTVKYNKGSSVVVKRAETTKDGDKADRGKKMSFTETYQTLLYPYEILKQNKKAKQTYIDNLNKPWSFTNPLFLEPLHIMSTYFSSIRNQTPVKEYKTEFFEISEFKYEDLKIVFIDFNRPIRNTGALIIECYDKSGKLILVRYQNVSYELINGLNSTDYTKFFEKTRSGNNLTAYQYDGKGNLKKASKYTGVFENDIDSQCGYDDVTNDLLSEPDFKPISIINHTEKK